MIDFAWDEKTGLPILPIDYFWRITRRSTLTHDISLRKKTWYGSKELYRHNGCITNKVHGRFTRTIPNAAGYLMGRFLNDRTPNNKKPDPIEGDYFTGGRS